jgi:hypothetical protein
MYVKTYERPARAPAQWYSVVCRPSVRAKQRAGGVQLELFVGLRMTVRNSTSYLLTVQDYKYSDELWTS